MLRTMLRTIFNVLPTVCHVSVFIVHTSGIFNVWPGTVAPLLMILKFMLVKKGGEYNVGVKDTMPCAAPRYDSPKQDHISGQLAT